MPLDPVALAAAASFTVGCAGIHAMRRHADVLTLVLGVLAIRARHWWAPSSRGAPACPAPRPVPRLGIRDDRGPLSRRAALRNCP